MTDDKYNRQLFRKVDKFQFKMATYEDPELTLLP